YMLEAVDRICEPITLPVRSGGGLSSGMAPARRHLGIYGRRTDLDRGCPAQRRWREAVLEEEVALRGRDCESVPSGAGGVMDPDAEASGLARSHVGRQRDPLRVRAVPGELEREAVARGAGGRRPRDGPRVREHNRHERLPAGLERRRQRLDAERADRLPEVLDL